MHPSLPDYNPQVYDKEPNKEYFEPNQSRFTIHNTKSPVDQIHAVPKNSIDEGICTSLGD